MGGACAKDLGGPPQAILDKLPRGADGVPNFICAMAELDGREEWAKLVEEFGGPVPAWSRLKRAMALL